MFYTPPTYGTTEEAIIDREATPKATLINLNLSRDAQLQGMPLQPSLNSLQQRSYNPTHPLPTIPSDGTPSSSSLMNFPYRRSRLNQQPSLPIISNHSRNSLPTFDLEKQARYSWSFDEQDSAQFEASRRCSHPDLKKKRSIVDFFRRLF